MEKLNEVKQEKLPLDFITSFVSKGWDEVGVLKASIDAIKKDFRETKQVELILSDLVDAYLICLSRLQAHMNNKDYIELPEEKELKESVDSGIKYFDSDKETGLSCGINSDGDLFIGDDKSGSNLTDTPENRDKLASTWKQYTGKDLVLTKDDASVADSEADISIEDIADDELPEEEPEKVDGDKFEYFVDFDDPMPDEDTDLEIRHWLQTNR